jgi:hypothetical protein
LVSPQVRTKYIEHSGKGAKPLIVEFVSILKGLRRATHFTRGLALCFILRRRQAGTSKVPDVADARLYTFVKKRNELYRGSSLVQSNVAEQLPSSPVRSYSTKNGIVCLRRVLKGLK